MHVTADFLVPAVAEELIDVSLSNDKKALTLKIQIPSDFIDQIRLQEKMAKERKNFDKNSHEASSFQSVIDEIKKSKDYAVELFGGEQKV